MIESLELGKSYWIRRDGTDERFVAEFQGFEQWRHPVVIMRLVPARLLVIDAVTEKTDLVERIAAMDHFADTTGFPPFPIPVNLYRITTAQIQPYANPWGFAVIEGEGE